MQREFNKQIEDECYKQRQQEDFSKKLKYITTNHVDLLNAKDNYNFFGIAVKDYLTVPAEKIESETLLKLDNKKLTNCKCQHELGTLPLPTLPAKYQLQHGDVEIEDHMGNFVSVNRKGVLPIVTDFHDKHFEIFTNTVKPDPIKATEDFQRAGIPTRFL